MEEMRNYRIIGNIDEDRKKTVKEELGATAKNDRFIGLSEDSKEKIQKLEYKKMKVCWK